MAYTGLVTNIVGVRKAPNSDNLYLGSCFGEDVLIGKDIQEGELVLYLPSDGRVERWFGDDFHLFRKNKDGTPQGGYLDDNGHVKAIKLRGNFSYGIVVSCEKIFTKYGDLGWKAGDTPTKINDKVFCQKYIPRPSDPSKRHNSNKSGGGLKKGQMGNNGVTYPNFKEHIDTKQLAYNLDQFLPGDIISISLKLHGCWTSDAKVRMADGKLKKITSIRPGDMVLGYDMKTKKIVSTKVLHVFHNAPSEQWNKVKISRNGLLGDKRGTQTSTWNHKYWVEEKQQWIMAKDLQVGDAISSLTPSPILTSLQKAVAIGSFLGDGCLRAYHGRTADIQESKKSEHKTYLDFLNNITQGWFYTEKTKRTSGYGTEMFTSRSARSVDLYNYLDDCTTWENKPHLPRLKPGIIDKIKPISIAMWYMGDGSLSHNENQQDRASLAICRYDTKEDLDIIKSIFNKFHIVPSFFVDSKGYNRIRFNLNEANKLFSLIAKYVPDIMQYKLPVAYQNQYVKIQDPEKYNPSGWTLSPQVVLENTPLQEVHDEWDLETELHNYIVGSSIVHNTSGRTARTDKYYPKGFFRRLLHLPAKHEECFVLGSRRRVIEGEDHYYGDDFRQQHHDRICEAIGNDRLSVYYEIVGYTNNGTPIMPIYDTKKLKDKKLVDKYGSQMVFSYGCEPGTSRFFIYRIVADDGREFTPGQIDAWCRIHGLEAVPVLENFQFTNVDDLMEHVRECLAGLTDPIGLDHIKEGVVVRIVNRPTFTAFKSKEPAFLVLEGIQKDMSDTPDIEEAEEAVGES